MMYCHCDANNKVQRWTFIDPWKLEVRPGILEESVSPDWLATPFMYSRHTVNTRGVTIYRYIAIHEEFISYRNTKFVSQYIATFLSSNQTVYFAFNSCLVTIASPEDACQSHVYPYKRSLYSHVCM